MSSGRSQGLSSIERAALGIGRRINQVGIPKRLQYRFIRNLAYHWVKHPLGRRTYVDNVDWLVAPPSDRGVLFACNHRSFFDAFCYLACIFSAGAKWPRKLYFPVRSDFFYDNPVGLLLNLGVGANVMYPPVYRKAEQRHLNKKLIDSMIEVINEPHCLVGMHPEGKRNLSDDPYTLLKAHPGVGQIVLQAKPMVVPVFVNGLSNDPRRVLELAFSADAKTQNPVTVVFGNALPLSEFEGQTPRTALYKKCADKICHAIEELGHREKLLRGKILSGEIPRDHPNWVRPDL